MFNVTFFYRPILIGMGSNYYGQAMNMGQGFQQQGQQLSGKMGGQVPSPQQQWQHLMKQGQQAAGGGSK